MIKYIFLSIIPFIYGYELLGNYIPTNLIKTFTFCLNEKKILRETTNDVIDYINDYDIFHISLKSGYTEPVENQINSICSIDKYRYGYYGYTSLFNTNESDIYISKELYDTPNTLFNVLLHEFVHSLGLNHTLVPSVMQYSIMIDERNNIINDRRKIYLSLDDIRGLRAIKRSIKCGIQ